MLTAILSDIHANLEAFEACLAHAHAHGAQGHAFLGDLVGYGADPAAVIERIQAFAARGAPVVLGNHDAGVLTPNADFEDLAAEALAWTRDALAPRHFDFLATLPYTAALGDALLVHASAHEPPAWHYLHTEEAAAQSLAATEAPHTFVGHVHRQILYYGARDGTAVSFQPTPGVPIPVPAHRKWLAVVGSAGQPRDRNPAACYAMFDDARRMLTFHRVPYDVEAAARKIIAAGLPEWMAHRLEHGM